MAFQDLIFPTWFHCQVKFFVFTKIEKFKCRNERVWINTLAVLLVLFLFFVSPGLAFAKNLLISDSGTGDVRVFDLEANSYSGSFGQTAAELTKPEGLAFHPVTKNLLVADSFLGKVLEFDGNDGSFLGVFGQTEPNLLAPFGLAFHPASGNLFVADATHDDVREFDGTTGAFIGSFGDSANFLTNPKHILFHPVTSNLLVSGGNGGEAREFDNATGSFIGVFGDTGDEMSIARGMVFQASTGNLFVADFGGFQIHKFDGNSGTAQSAFPGSNADLNRPIDLAFDDESNVLYVVDTRNKDIPKFHPDSGALLGILPIPDSSLRSPNFLAVQEDGAVTLPLVSFNNSSSSASESVGQVVVQVQLSSSSALPVEVDYQASGGTAAGGGTDYFLLGTGSLAFDPGETEKNLMLSIVDDVMDEDDETVVLTLSNPVNAHSGSPNSHTLKITDNDGPPEIGFSADASFSEEGSLGSSVEVVLSKPSGNSVTVMYSITGGSAQGGGVDYDAPGIGTLTFAPGDTSESIELLINDDEIDESDETVLLTLSDAVGATLNGLTDHTVTILDDDPVPGVAFETGASEGSEFATPAMINVVLTNPSGEPVSVDIAHTGGSALGGGMDFDLPENLTVEFSAGETVKSVNLAITDDSLDENNETVELGLTNPQGAVLQEPGTHIHTILDNDGVPSVSFDADTSSASESQASASISVSLSNASGLSVAVDYSISGGGATGGGVDYQLLGSGTLDFTPGETHKSIDLSINDDLLDEPDETVLLILADPLNAQSGTHVNHEFTIQDNDGIPTVAFESSKQEGDESVTPSEVRVVLSNPSASTVSVDVAVSGGTATGAGVDYEFLDSGLLEFIPGETVRTLELSITDDLIDEAGETVVLELSQPTNALLGDTNSLTHTILDNDGTPTVAFSRDHSDGLETVALPVIPVILSNPSDSQVTVNYNVLGGTATEQGQGDPFDFSLNGQQLVFDPGVTEQFIDLSVLDDLLDETDETIEIGLTEPVNAVLGEIANHEYSIIDDEGQPSVFFEIAESSVSESDGSVNLSVKLSNSSGLPVTVDYSVSGGTATGGGVDFNVPGSGQLSFAPGEIQKTFLVEVTDDSLHEANETVLFMLSNPGNAELGTDLQYELTLLDNESEPTVSFDVAEVNGPESQSSATILVTLSHATSEVVTVEFSHAGGTAEGGGVDFSLAEGLVLEFTPGVTEQSVSIEIVNDDLDEADETIDLQLTNPENAQLGTIIESAYSILDDDEPVVPEVAFVSPDSSEDEATPVVNIPVRLSEVTTVEVAVTYQLTGGTATGEGEDFTLLGTGTLIFPAGTAEANIDLALVDDEVFDPDETLTLQLSDPVSATLGSEFEHTFTILDNDPAPPEILVAFDLAGSETSEANTTASIQVSLSEEADETVTVNYEVTGGNAFNGFDFSLTGTGTLNFDPGVIQQSIHIDIGNDSDIEDDETVILSLSNPSGALLGTLTSHTFTILDDDEESGSGNPEDPLLEVLPGRGILVAGTVGGPFSPDSVDITLSNTGDASIEYSVSHNETWLTLAQPDSTGTLAANSSVQLTLQINASANALNVGDYSDTLTFRDITNGVDITRVVNLEVLPEHHLTITSGPDSLSNPADSLSEVEFFVVAEDTRGFDLDYLWTADCSAWSDDNGTFDSASLPQVVWAAPENGSGESKDCVIHVTVSNEAAVTGSANDALVLSVDGSFNLSVRSLGILNVFPEREVFATNFESEFINPETISYQVSNEGGMPLEFSVSHTQSWGSFDSDSGSLEPGQSLVVNFQFNESATNQTEGLNVDVISFNNLSGGWGDAERELNLIIDDGQLNEEVTLEGNDFITRCDSTGCELESKTYTLTNMEAFQAFEETIRDVVENFLDEGFTLEQIQQILNLPGTQEQLLEIINGKVEPLRFSITLTQEWLDLIVNTTDSESQGDSAGDLTFSGTLGLGESLEFDVRINSNVQDLEPEDTQGSIIVQDTDTGEVLAFNTVKLDFGSQAFPNVPSSQRVVSPYWQTDSGSYTFIGVTHPSLSGMNSQIGVVMSAVENDGSIYGNTIEFTVRSGSTHKLFIVGTNNSSINSNNIPTATFISATSSFSHGQLVISPKADNPHLKLGNANAIGSGFPDITMLSFWGAVVVQETSTGFAMEFVGDVRDSRSFNTITPPTGLN